MANIKLEILEKITTLITAAFGFVAALAWNDAIKSLFMPGGALENLATYGPWLYAILVTVIAVIVTIWLAKMAKKFKGSR